MPHAFKLDKEHAKDGLVVILDESQATKDKADLLGFVIQNFIKYGQFSTSGVFITNGESPFPSGSSGIPYAALIGVDGKLLLIGSPSGWGKKLDEAIEPEFKKIKSGWGKSAEAKKVRASCTGRASSARPRPRSRRPRARSRTTRRKTSTRPRPSSTPSTPA